MSKYRKCIFCKGTDLSKEHIFAQWLLKELQITNNEFTMTHGNIFGHSISTRTHTYSNLVNGLVCKDCNNGWMSQLESFAQKHITNLMNLNGITEELAYLNENYNTIAKWVFKNVILLNSATNYRLIVPENHYFELFSGKIPDGVFIDMAFCENDVKLDWRQTPRFFSTLHGDLDYNPYVNSYHITFQIRRLLFKVVYYGTSFKIDYENDGVLRLFPTFGRCGDPKMFDDIDNFNREGMLHVYLK